MCCTALLNAAAVNWVGVVAAGFVFLTDSDMALCISSCSTFACSSISAYVAIMIASSPLVTVLGLWQKNAGAAAAAFPRLLLHLDASTFDFNFPLP